MAANTALQEAINWLAANAPDHILEFLDEAHDILVDVSRLDNPSAEKIADLKAAATKLIEFVPPSEA